MSQTKVSAQQDRNKLDDNLNDGVLNNSEDNQETDYSEDSNSDDSANVDKDLDNEKEAEYAYSNDEVDAQPQKPSSFMFYFLSSSFLVVILLLMVPCFTPDIETVVAARDISRIKTRFPEQSEDFWLFFESGVADVVTMNRPSTFIFLYDKTSEKKLKNLITELSTYAICNIRECDKTPINLTDSKLNSPEILADYGSLIEEYRAELADKGVMVIHNLERIRGISAQAFHSFCDEFSPLVQKSLFIFTMKVDKLPRNNQMRFVEEDLKKRWTEIKPDILVALITRITSMVLEVV